MNDTLLHLVHVRDRPAFLQRVMTVLAGGARMSLEGDLSRCRFTDDLVLSRDAIGTLNRNTIWPRLDFVVLKLEPETVAPILKQVVSAGIKRGIRHIQIERDGVKQLGAYDNFDPECVVTGPQVSPDLLEAMKVERIIHSFKPAKHDE